MRPSADLNAIKFAAGESVGHYSFDGNHFNTASGSSQPTRDQHQRCLMTDAHNPMPGPCGSLCHQQRGARSMRSPHVAQMSPAFNQINQVLRHQQQQQPRSCSGFGPIQNSAYDRVPIHSAPSQMAFDFVQVPSRCHRPELMSPCHNHHLAVASSSTIQHRWHDQGQHYYWQAQFKQPAAERVDLVANLSQRRISVSSPVLFDKGEQFEHHSVHCDYHHELNHYSAVTFLESGPSRTFHPISNDSRDARNELPAARLIAENTVPHYHQHQHFHATQEAPVSNQRVDSLVQNHYINNSNNRVERHQRKLSSIISSDSELCRQSPHLREQLSNCTIRDKSFSSSSVSSSLSSSSVANHQIRLARSDLANAHQPTLSAVKFPQAARLRRSVHPLDGLLLHREGSSTTSEASCGQQHGRRSQSSQQDLNSDELPQQAQRADCRERPFRVATQTDRLDDSQQVTSELKETEANGENNQRVQSGKGTGGQGVKLAASGKSRSLMHSPIGLAAAATLGKVSLAGAKRRLGFKQNRGLNSLSVHRSEEIFPSELKSNCHHYNQFDQFMSINTTANVSCSLNESSLEFDYNHQVGSPRQLQRKWLKRFNSELPDPKVCFVDGLGLGQVVSRQALVSPYLGDIQISLSDRRGMLEVEVIRVRQLQAQPRAKRPPSFYVKVYLMKDKRCLAKVKTSSISHTLNPFFQQLFIFRESYKDCVLQIIVWANYGKNGRKSLTGLVQIQLNKLDISNVIIGWYRLFNAPSMVANQSIASSSKSLRQTLSTTKLADSG